MVGLLISGLLFFLKSANIFFPRFILDYLPKCLAQDFPGSGDSPECDGNPEDWTTNLPLAVLYLLLQCLMRPPL